MTIAETLRTAGSKIGKALKPRAETSEELFMAISRIEATLPTRAAKRAKIFGEQRATTTFNTPEFQKLEDQLIALAAEDAADERKIKNLWALHAEAKKREAAAARADQATADAAQIEGYDNGAKEGMAIASEITEHLAAGKLLWRRWAGWSVQFLADHPALDERDIHPQELTGYWLDEAARIGAVAQDHNVREYEWGVPGAVVRDGLNLLDQPEAITPLAEVLAGRIALSRHKVVADPRAPTAAPSQAELDELSAAAGRKIAQMLKDRHNPHRLEMYDVEPQSAPQRSDYASDGLTPVGPVDHAALAAEAEDRLSMFGRHPPAEDRWDTTRFGPEVIDTRNRHNEPEPGKEPAWQPGIEPFEAGRAS